MRPKFPARNSKYYCYYYYYCYCCYCYYWHCCYCCCYYYYYYDDENEDEDNDNYYYCYTRTKRSVNNPLHWQVNVTDVNDNAPEFDDGPSLVLFVAENTPVGHTLWSLTAHDADDPVTNGELLYEVELATAAGVLSVSRQGDILLLASPDYEALQQVRVHDREAEETLRIRCPACTVRRDYESLPTSHLTFS